MLQLGARSLEAEALVHPYMLLAGQQQGQQQPQQRESV